MMPATPKKKTDKYDKKLAIYFYFSKRKIDVLLKGSATDGTLHRW